MILPSLLVGAALPMRLLRRRSLFLERLLRLQLSEPDVESVRRACAYCDTEFGAYYYWYAQKLVVNQSLRKLGKRATLDMIMQMDRSDYASLDALRDHSNGLIVATPHHGHYILSIVALAERLRSSREILIFYGAPDTHPGNEMFDYLYSRLFGDASSGVRVIHDNRKGILHALRGLNAGAVVVIMPDVYKNEEDTYVIPFCGRPLNVMLGTAALARKTQSAILPMISLPTGIGPLGFNSVFGRRMADGVADLPSVDHDTHDIDVVHTDYRVTLKMFTHFESVMAKSVVHWQYIRSHFTRQVGFPEITSTSAKMIDDLVSSDPRFTIDRSGFIRID